MKTKVYETYEQFASREDKSANGVSPAFAEKHPDYEKENESNVGCWNCIYCNHCSYCRDCEGCQNCKDCKACNHGAQVVCWSLAVFLTYLSICCLTFC